MAITEDGFAPPRHHTNDPRNVRREGETMPEFIARVATENTFEPRDADDRIFGGDNKTSKAKAMNLLRYQDRRLAPFAHQDLLSNVLRMATMYESPTGSRFTNEFLEGKLVGLLLFSETARSESFLPLLSEFAANHPDDFVVVGLSYCDDEATHKMKRFGFSQLLHRNGAQFVKRDCGYFPTAFNPLPKLYIAEGTTGEIIDRSGLTSVVARPSKCFDDWVHHRPGSTWYHQPLAWML